MKLKSGIRLQICLHFAVLVLVAVCCSQANAASVAQIVDECLSRLQPAEAVSASSCPELFANSHASSDSIAVSLEFPHQPKTKDLVELSRHLTAVGSRKSIAAVKLNLKELSTIMDDYDYTQEDEGISLAARFSAWLAEKLRNSGLMDKLDSIGNKFSMEPETRLLILKIIGWTMGLALLIAAICFVWILWRFLDPSLSRRRRTTHVPIDTGAQRGNMPIMTLAQIQQLPTNQQPPALLVACLDRLKGKELPDNIWKATNSEIVQRLTRQKSLATTPMRRLIQIAEKTLYGEHSADAADIDSCFSAASEIFQTPGEPT